MTHFQEEFERYGGNYKEVMERFMDNEALYLRLLKMLEKDDSLKKMRDALQAEDLNGAFEAAHTLKGVVGNLGLAPLYQAVCLIVEPLRQREDRDYTKLYQAVEQEYERACGLVEVL